MSMSVLMITTLMSGLALFMFGMMVLEETVHSSFGNNIKQSIQKYAGGLLRSIGIGVVSTAVLQSSMIVIMLMLGFIGANILSLTQGIGVVFGANIGTTLTPWLIALGSEFDISGLTMRVLAAGGILYFLGMRYKSVKVIAKFVISIGLLLLGLGFMKGSVDGLAANFSLADSNVSLFQSILIGFVATVVLQTSTGSSILALTALSSGLITFDIGLGVMIGANFGSAVGPFLLGFFSSSKSQLLKKVIVSTHLLGNFLMLIIMLILFVPVKWFLSVIGLDSTPVIGLAAFHTLYNLVGVLCLAPFTSYYVKFLEKKGWAGEKKSDILFAIEQSTTDLPEEYISLMKEDVEEFIHDSLALITSLVDYHTDDSTTTFVENVTLLQKQLEEWLDLVVLYSNDQVTNKQDEEFYTLQVVVGKYSNALRQLKDSALSYYALQEHSAGFVSGYIEKFNEKIIRITDLVSLSFDTDRDALENKITVMNKALAIDDVLFVKDIRKSILKYGHNTDNETIWSSLIKLNRSIVLYSKELLDASEYYVGINKTQRTDMVSLA